MSGDVVLSPSERLLKAAERTRAASGKAAATPFDPIFGEHLAFLLEGMAAHWAARPIADWAVYNMSPLAAVERHINEREAGEETP